MVGHDDQLVSVRKRHRRFPEKRGSQDEFAGSRADGIQAQGGKHVPGAQLAAVLVAAKTVRRRLIEFLQDPPDQALRLGRRAQAGVQPGRSMAGLIPMGIEAHETGDIAVMDRFRPVFIGEEGIQGSADRTGAAHQVRITPHVVRDIVAVLPGDGFRIIPGGTRRIEGRTPVPVRFLPAEKSG